MSQNESTGEDFNYLWQWYKQESQPEKMLTPLVSLCPWNCSAPIQGQVVGVLSLLTESQTKGSSDFKGPGVRGRVSGERPRVRKMSLNLCPIRRPLGIMNIRNYTDLHQNTHTSWRSGHPCLFQGHFSLINPENWPFKLATLVFFFYPFSFKSSDYFSFLEMARVKPCFLARGPSVSKKCTWALSVGLALC